jgi:hypothetical protein
MRARLKDSLVKKEVRFVRESPSQGQFCEERGVFCP